MPSALVRIDLDLLYPRFCELVLELLANCKTRGVNYYATGGFRSPEEQMTLWQKGRNAIGAVVDPSKIVTKLQFGAHNCGIAADFTFDKDPDIKGLQPRFNRPDYDILSEEALKLGLEPGHGWKSFPDSPHVQLPLGKYGISFRGLKDEYAKGGIEAVFAVLDEHNW